MRTRVTAILVARQGGEWLDQTIAGLAAQTRRPDRVIAVSNGGSERVAGQLASAGPERVVTTTGQLSFGQAVQRAIDTLPEPAGDDEWFWLLSEDSAPEPAALERVLSTVQRAPSVAIAGPKLVDWDHPERIIELGQSLTRSGSRWMLRRQELDQQQYDHLQDVLGVGPVGMLARRDAWAELGGFDPALPVFDDGLDFSVRARLAGYRVVVSPESRIRFAQSGVAGPRIDRRRSVMRTAHRQARTAHLHRRIAYAPGFLAFVMWLGLPLLGVARVFWALIREQPGQMLGEFAAAFTVFFRPGAILASRRRIRAASSAGWAAVRPLRVDPKAVRTARMIDREAILASQGRQRRELHFVSSGGLTVLVVSMVAAVALCWWALSRTSLVGGALAPLSPVGELWQNTFMHDGVPADPFAWVLAVLGSLTFWNPSHIVVLVFIAAIPLSALGGWIWGAQLTESRAGRVLLGLGWALSPVLLGSLSSGRLPTLILAVALPWLLLAASRCRESWSWAGTASLLAAVVLACAPVLIPAAVLLLIVGLCTSLRGIARVLSTAIAPLVLFAPKTIAAFAAGRPIDLLLDPGITPAYQPGNTWHLMLGFPAFGLEGWSGIFDAMGLGGAPATLLVGVLLAPIALLAVLGLLTGRIAVTLLLALAGGLGFVTAIGAAQLHLLIEGPESVALWTGSGIALYWLSVLGLAAVGCSVLRRVAGPLVAVALVAALLAVAPLAVRLVTDQTGLRSADAQMPAIVQAAGAADPEIRTLVLTATGPQEVRAELVTGTGVRLDQIRTSERAPSLTAEDRVVGRLVGGLASTGGPDLRGDFAKERIGFVLLAAGGDDGERGLLQSAFDQQTTLSSAGQTAHGLLWRVEGQAASDGGGSHSDGKLTGTSLSATTIWWAQAIVLLAMLLLALPTGEVVDRPERRKKPKRRRGDDPATGPNLAATSEASAPEPAAVPDRAAEVPPEVQPPAQPEPASAPEPEPTAEPGAAAESAPAAEPTPEPEAEPSADPDPAPAAAVDADPAAEHEDGPEEQKR